MTAVAATLARHPAWRRRVVLFLVVGPPFLYLLVLYVAPLFAMLSYIFGESDGVDKRLTWNVDQYERLYHDMVEQVRRGRIS